MIDGKVVKINQRNIESEERTALSFLIGLRQKYAMEIDENISYTSRELHSLMTNVLNKIRRHKLTPIDLQYIFNPPRKEKGEVWGYIDEQVKRSKIKRYDWEGIFGHSLTKEILRLKKQSKTVNEAYMIILKDVRVQAFIEENKSEQYKIMENLKICVYARYGENNTAKRIEEE